MSRFQRLRVRVGLWIAGVSTYQNRDGDAIVLRAPRRLSLDEVKEIRERWEVSFGGPHNTHVPAGVDLSVRIDRFWYRVDKQFMSGAELRNLPTPAISDDLDLWEVVPGSTEDIKISAAAVIEMKDRMQFFTAPRVISAGSLDGPGSGEPIDERYLGEKQW